MEKQNKIIKKTKYKNGSSKQMQTAKFNPVDEYYTPLNLVSKELNHYGTYFKGKNIICPCDCDILEDKPVYKIVIEFSEEREEWFASQTGYINAVERLTYYTLENGKYVPTVIYGDEARDFISEKIICNIIKTVVNIGEDYGVKSITASGFDTNKQEGIKFDEVDYSLYDLIITNPPFSQYQHLMKTIMPKVRERKDTDKPLDFILLASYRNRVNPAVGEGLMLKEFYLGFGRHLSIKFPKYSLKSKKKKEVAVDWITTFDDAQCLIDSEYNVSGVDYELYKEEFPEMTSMTMRDGTHPIQIHHKGTIPDNYYGWMKCSGGALDNLNYNEFEWYITNAKGLYNKRNPDFNPFNHKVDNYMLDYHGIVIRRKKVA